MPRLSKQDHVDPAMDESAALPMPDEGDQHSRPTVSLDEPLPSGLLVNGRYRIVSRVGTGGMGEVYRADDRTLSQTVALKFLPAASDERARELMLNEVRLARRVSHPNVCRVHDIGEYRGRTFISMEYVDGETLAQLLAKIGRLPADKGATAAKQVCFGLAAAHAQGVLHRDLKPANVMIDSKGEVKITDFGLAGLADELRYVYGRTGTPAYMAPEQLDGKPPSVRSDIYSLGLVLHEIFTGRAVYSPKTISELRELQKRPIAAPSLGTPTLDTGVERVILECLDRDAEHRPAGALEVAAMLPGGDILGAAVGAGLMPSPDLLARARAPGVLERTALLLTSVLTAMLLVVVVTLAGNTMLMPRVHLPKPREVLVDRAREIIASFGYTPEAYSVGHFDYYEELVSAMARDDRGATRWDILERARPSPVDFWYRERDLPLVTNNERQRVDMRDPPFEVSGDTSVRLDAAGRLRDFFRLTTLLDLDAVGEARPVVSAAPREANWALAFESAGLEIDRFTEVQPVRQPATYSDLRRAWMGVYPELPDERVRVAISSYEGKITSFRIVELKWASASVFFEEIGGMPRVFRSARVAGPFLLAAGLVVGAILAWRNVNGGLADRRGAIRMSVTAFFIAAFARFMLSDPMLDSVALAELLARCGRVGSVTALTFWVFYVAAEPYVRRHWPQAMVAWSHLLAGRWRDSQLGVNLVVGVSAGVGVTVLTQLRHIVPMLSGLPEPELIGSSDLLRDALAGARQSIGQGATLFLRSLIAAMLLLIAFVGVRLAVRRTWLAIGIVVLSIGVVVATIGSVEAKAGGPLWSMAAIDFVYATLVAAACMHVLTRFGLVALIVGMFVYFLLTTFPITTDAGAWYFSSTISLLGVVVAIGALGLAMGFSGPRPRTA
ncbi:MAG: protein kinase [Phycisphaerales bacterium]